MLKKIAIFLIIGSLSHGLALASEKKDYSKQDAKDAGYTTKISTSVSDHGEFQKVVTTTCNFKSYKLITTYTYKKDHTPYSVYMDFPKISGASQNDITQLLCAHLLSIDSHIHSIANNLAASTLLNTTLGVIRLSGVYTPENPNSHS